MAVILDTHALFYAAVPKVACTALKEALFALENGFPFRGYRINGQPRHIHNSGYPTLLRGRYPEARIAGYHRVAFVRDPVRRFLSAYANRVVALKELTRAKAGPALAARGLPETPSLAQFIDRFEAYADASASIAHHTRPMVEFLGDDPDYFARLYRLDEMARFIDDIAARTGHQLQVAHRQTGGPKIAPDTLSTAQRRKIEAHYASDYAAFGRYL